MRVKVKICGITRLSDLEASIDAGADAVGFIVGFPNSPRNISIKLAKRLIDHVPPFVTSVLVTRFINIENLKMLYNELRPDALQLYYCDSPLRVKKDLPEPFLIIPSNPEEAKLMNNFDGIDALLLDSCSHELPGGTGKTHNWDLSRMIRDRIGLPIILSGGLTPDNVSEAIMKVRPYAVDVSSGVELSPGIKDHEKIRMFVERAKAVMDSGL
ncbi:MAG: phosphoribosylanthranilate isomerase [Halobacteria archaeon]